MSKTEAHVAGYFANMGLLNTYVSCIKPIIDYMGALVLFVISSPMMVLVWMSLYIAYGGKRIIFVQDRIGLNGKAFNLLKFRTLKLSQEDTSIGHTSQEITFIGAILRRFGIDEWPQLMNVLQGEMSLVGPRPLPLEYKNILFREYPWRSSIKPGITGLVQVKGGNSLSWPNRFVYDRYYGKYVSVCLDIKILCCTVISIFKKDRLVISEKLEESR